MLILEKVNMYRNIIFDLDGTLINSEPGILHCFSKAMSALGLCVPDKSLKGAIGMRLPDIFSTRLDVPDQQLDQAVRLYREEYSNSGLRLSELYPGVLRVLSSLKNRGYRLSAATLKAEHLAVKILDHLGIKDYFDTVAGVDPADVLRKPDLIKKCLASFPLNECAMVGDSVSDASGAADVKIDFIGITYGYGFGSSQEIERYRPKFVADHPEGLLEFFI